MTWDLDLKKVMADVFYGKDFNTLLFPTVWLAYVTLPEDFDSMCYIVESCERYLQFVPRLMPKVIPELSQKLLESFRYCESWRPQMKNCFGDYFNFDVLEKFVKLSENDQDIVWPSLVKNARELD